MDTDTFILLSSALTFGVPLLLAFRELWLLRNAEGSAGGLPPRDRRSPVAPPPGPARGGPAVPRPLPECLIRAAQGLPPAPPVHRPARAPELV